MANDNAEKELKQWEDVVSHIRYLLRNISHGSITIFVQDGKVLQIDHTEKQRLPNPIGVGE
jgi:hypothetical protein